MKWLADENLDNNILRGLQRRIPAFDVIRVQDVPEIRGADDITVLAWATRAKRVLLTHDLATMIRALQIHLQSEASCTPIVLVPSALTITMAIGDIALLNECATEADWAAGVIYLPLA